MPFASPIIRVLGDEVAISGYHVPKTQGYVSNAGVWASSNNFSGPFTSAQAAFQTQWTIIKNMTDETAQKVAQYESKSGAPDAIAKTQELLNSPFSGNIFVTIKKFMQLIGAILNPSGIYWSVRAAGEAFKTPSVVVQQIGRGTYDIFGQSGEMEAKRAEIALTGSLTSRIKAGYRQDSLPTAISNFNTRSANIVSAIQGSDSIAIFMAAESLQFAIDQVVELFGKYQDQLTSKNDSAWVQLSNYDSLLAMADTASIIANMHLMNGYLIAFGLQLNPHDSEFNALATTGLDSASIHLVNSWQVVDSIQQLTSNIPATPTLIFVPHQDYYLVSRDSQFVVNYTVTNIGTAPATGVYSRTFPSTGITLHSPDSVSLPDVSPGDSMQASYTVSLDSVSNPTSLFETSTLDIAVYALNGNGSQVGVPITALTAICGDVNRDKKLSVSDVVYLINYLFKGGPPPSPFVAADANCDTQVSIADVVYLINYLFKGGKAPCS